MHIERCFLWQSAIAVCSCLPHPMALGRDPFRWRAFHTILSPHGAEPFIEICPVTCCHMSMADPAAFGALAVAAASSRQQQRLLKAGALPTSLGTPHTPRTAPHQNLLPKAHTEPAGSKPANSRNQETHQKETPYLQSQSNIPTHCKSKKAPKRNALPAVAGQDTHPLRQQNFLTRLLIDASQSSLAGSVWQRFYQ